jgi:hypothetical protein
MAKPRLQTSFGGSIRTPLPSRLSATADPWLSIPTPVQWHTPGPSGLVPPPTETPPPAPAGSGLWKRVKQTVLFWQVWTDPVQVSVFGPPALTPGQTARVTVVLHVPAVAASVRTLARAFHHEAELIGTGHLTREVAPGAELAVHLAAANAGVGQSLLTFRWRGQPHRLAFDLHVPWESPAGLAPGLASVGQENVRIGRIEFHLRILPRRG